MSGCAQRYQNRYNRELQLNKIKISYAVFFAVLPEILATLRPSRTSGQIRTRKQHSRSYPLIASSRNWEI